MNKPCPFCGGSETQFYYSEGGVGLTVGCLNKACQAEGPWRLSTTEATEAWNIRAEPAQKDTSK